MPPSRGGVPSGFTANHQSSCIEPNLPWLEAQQNPRSPYWSNRRLCRTSRQCFLVLRFLIELFADAVSGAVSARVAATADVASAVVGILADEAALAGIGAFAGDDIALGINVDAAAGASDRALAVAGGGCTGA